MFYVCAFIAIFSAGDSKVKNAKDQRVDIERNDDSPSLVLFATGIMNLEPWVHQPNNFFPYTKIPVVQIAQFFLLFVG